MYLIKFVKEWEHAKKLMHGQLYMNTLSSYRKLEETQAAGRADDHEGMSIHQGPHLSEVTLSLANSTLTIPNTDIVHISTSHEDFDRRYIYCLFGGYPRRKENIGCSSGIERFGGSGVG